MNRQLHDLLQGLLDLPSSSDEIQCTLSMCNDAWESLQLESSIRLKPFNCYARAADLPILSNHWSTAVAEEYRLLDACYGERHNVSIRALRTLMPGRMINDEIVAAYLALVRPVAKDFHIADPFLLAVTKHRSFEKQKILIPIVDSMHWTFVYIIIVDGRAIVEYFESLSTTPPIFVMKWLEQEFCGAVEYRAPKHNPNQGQDRTNCALFMMIGIRLIATSSQHISQSEADDIVPYLRERVFAELIANKLDPTIEDYESYILSRVSTAQSPSSLSGQVPSAVLNLFGDSVRSPVDLCSSGPSPVSDFIPIAYKAKNVVQSPAVPYDASPSPSSGLITIAYQPENVSPMPQVANASAERCGAAPSILKSASSQLHSKAVVASPVEKGLREMTLRPPASPIKKKAKTTRDPTQLARCLAQEFGSEVAILEVLKHAVHNQRNIVCTVRNEDLASLYASIQERESTESHKLPLARYRHLRFALQFNAIASRDKGRKYQVSLLDKLHITGTVENRQREWNKVVACARKCDFWVALTNFFGGTLKNNSNTVLCGSWATTSALETLDRDLFFDILRERMAGKEGLQIIERFAAAAPLFNALVQGDLPSHKLLLETDHCDLDFKEVVSLVAAPTKRALTRIAST